MYMFLVLGSPYMLLCWMPIGVRYLMHYFRVSELDYKHYVTISDSDIVARATSLTDRYYTSSQEHLYHHMPHYKPQRM